MSPTRRYLIAIDDTPASLRALEHVGRRIHRGDDVTVRLLHVVGPMPTELLEFGGSSDPREEERLESELDQAQGRWFAEERTRCQPLFRVAERVLQDLGVDPNAVATRCVESIPEDDPVDLILQEARDARCDTVVVGRTALPWLREHFHRHLGEALRRRAGDIEVEVVG